MTPRIMLLAAGICLPLLAGQPDRRFEVVSTDRADLAPGATVRIEDSTGELNIEGWDQPQVEITVTRYRWGPDTPRGKEITTQKLNTIQVTKKSNGELTISTSHRRSIANNLDYHIMVPRSAKLIVRHRIGDVVIHGMNGDVDISAKVGDVVLQLAGESHYKIDARCKLGGVYSDMPEAASGAKAANAVLRVGVGGITIQSLGMMLSQDLPEVPYRQATFRRNTPPVSGGAELDGAAIRDSRALNPNQTELQSGIVGLIIRTVREIAPVSL